MTDFLKAHDHTEAIRAAFPAFDTLSFYEKSELMRAWERKDRITLIQKWGLDSDEDGQNTGNGSEKQYVGGQAE